MDAPTTSVAPSETTRGMMRALADRLSMTVPVQAELVIASVRMALDSLIAGDLAGFHRARFAVSAALDGVTEALNESNQTDKAISSLDPNYAKAVMRETNRILVASYRSGYANVSHSDLVVRYVRHSVECQNPDTCAETIALKEEFSSRGLGIPTIKGGL